MIFVITHKKVELQLPQNYSVLSVGSYNGEKDGFISDQSGDSISSENPSFCELTGLYWIWKNYNKEDITGLVHYRRFFYAGKNILSYEKAAKYLEKCDVILPEKSYLRRTNFQHYVSEELGCGFEKDLQELRKVISEKHPDYLKEYDGFFNAKSAYFYNMMICRREVLNAYCEWLFDILFELQRRIDISAYDAYRKRIFGFMSERLLNIYVAHNKLKVKEVPVYKTGTTKTERFKNKLKNAAKRIAGIF